MSDTIMVDDGPISAAARVQRIRRLIADHQFGEALSAAESALLDRPENRDLLYSAAQSLRHLHRVPEALQMLDRLEQHHPTYSRLFEERGHCYVTQRDAPRAIDALLRAVNLNPALPASWAMLEGLYRLTGDENNRLLAAAHVTTLKNLSPDVVRATSFFSDGELTLAENLIRAYLLRAGNDVEAMRLLARIGFKRDVLDDAELLLDAVLTLAPDYLAARHDYALVLLERHKHAEAREQVTRLLAIEPHNPNFRVLYATTCVGLGEHHAAIQIYRELVDEIPDAEDLHLSLAHALKTVGERDESVREYRRATELRASFGDAWWSLANLKTYRFSDHEIERMRDAEAASNTKLVDRYHLCFALGKAHEDRCEFDISWSYYERGNALKRQESRYRAEIIETNTVHQKRICTAAFFDRRHGSGDSSPDPIFIVGLPRAGSTLLEQILASHPLVDGTQELADIPRLVLELQGREPNFDDPRYPGTLTELTRDALRDLGARYLKSTRTYRGNRPFFIDKMPNNFRHLGLIHLILPNAKIIDARREPMACCFSNLKQLFSNGQEFAYSVDDIARYYRTYLDLMEHWDQVLPNRVLRVLHEDIVEDLSGNVRRILDFCGLDFDPACIDFFQTNRSVRTASSEQVRQPIFRDGVDQWKNYAKWLSPLKAALGDAVTRYRT